MHFLKDGSSKNTENLYVKSIYVHNICVGATSKLGAVQPAEGRGGTAVRAGEGGGGTPGGRRSGLLRAAARGRGGAVREAEGGRGAGGHGPGPERLPLRHARRAGRQLRRAAGLPHDQLGRVPGDGPHQRRRHQGARAQDQRVEQWRRRRRRRGRRCQRWRDEGDG